MKNIMEEQIGALYHRIREHNNAINNKAPEKSAVAEHLIEKHGLLNRVIEENNVNQDLLNQYFKVSKIFRA